MIEFSLVYDRGTVNRDLKSALCDFIYNWDAQGACTWIKVTVGFDEKPPSLNLERVKEEVNLFCHDEFLTNQITSYNLERKVDRLIVVLTVDIANVFASNTALEGML